MFYKFRLDPGTRTHTLYQLYQTKELSLFHKHNFSYPYISATQCQYIFQTMNPVRLNIQSFKYQTFTLSGCSDIGIWKIMFVEKTQFLCLI